MSGPTHAPAWLAELRFDEQGLIPAIAQDATSGQVLMVAWMNEQAVLETVRSGQAVYFSRSRQRLWRKGERSGHVQQIHDIRLDCDGDVLLLHVHQAGGMACHTGRARCFYRQLQGGPAGHWVTTDPILKDPAEIYGDRDRAGAATPPTPENAVPAATGADTADARPTQAAGLDTADTLARLADTLATRLPERGGDPATSYAARLLAKGPDAYLKKIGEEATELVMAVKDGQPERVVAETADLWFHSLVALTAHGLRPDDVLAELARRQGLSGLAEKAARPKD